MSLTNMQNMLLKEQQLFNLWKQFQIVPEAVKSLKEKEHRRCAQVSLLGLIIRKWKIWAWPKLKTENVLASAASMCFFFPGFYCDILIIKRWALWTKYPEYPLSLLCTRPNQTLQLTLFSTHSTLAALSFTLFFTSLLLWIVDLQIRLVPWHGWIKKQMLTF